MTVLQEANPGKSLTIDAQGVTYTRFPVQTGTINVDDNFTQIILDKVSEFIQDGDVLLVAESVVAISQGRAYRFSEIPHGKMAAFYARFVTKTPAGIGLGTPQTMQLAINEAGLARISLAAAVAAVTRPFGLRGMFYQIAGGKARAIDGPTAGTLPPYNEFASLSPKNPREFAKNIEQEMGKDIQVIIVDANDLGVNILGAKDKNQEQLGEQLCADNPMGQGGEGTPLMICRKA